VEGFASTLAATPLAEAMRVSRWGYAAASGAHVLGIALLVGAILPYDLRLLGAFRAADPHALSLVLRPVAAAGLALACGAGALLFLADPAGYIAQPLFVAKLAFVAVGGAHALAWTGRTPHAAREGPRRTAALLSLLVWIGALALGRALAFTGD
jgi:hypothetical protein